MGGERRPVGRKTRPAWAVWLERAAIAAILLGFVSMCQPWTIAGFRYGFPVLLCGTLGYTVFSHF